MRTLFVCSLIFALFTQLASSLLPKGRSAWTYDVLGGEPAMWAPEIETFNAGDHNHSFNIIITYGGDMEYYPGTSQPYRTYFPNSESIKKYRKVKEVTDVLAIVDGRMDGGQSWSPDLSKLNATAIEEWADITAAIYCSYDHVAGIMVDLEPFVDPYKEHLLLFLTRLGQDLIDGSFGCVNHEFPDGRYLSTFVFAAAATSELYNALGPNGFAVISGYDLSTAPAGTPTEPSVYGQQLADVVSTAMTNAGNNGSFIVAIPGAASTHEFTKYVPQGGAAVVGYPMYSNTSDSYLTEAFTVLQQSGVYQHPGFLGISVWGFSSFMSYPPHSDNLFYPSTPFVSQAEEQFLRQNL